MPFASVADHFVTVANAAGRPMVAVVSASNASINEVPSHAGEPYGTVTFDNPACEFAEISPVSAERAIELAALMRAMQMAGAADKVLATAVEYCKQRVQFGRPLSTFQAIQQMLADSRASSRRPSPAPKPRHATPTKAGWPTAAASRSPRPRARLRNSPTASPASLTSRWARWASPTSISCTTTRAASGYGAATSAANLLGREDGTASPRPAPRRYGPR